MTPWGVAGGLAGFRLPPDPSTPGRARWVDLLESTFPKTPLGGTAVGLDGFRLPRDPSLSLLPVGEEPRTDLLGSDFPATTLSGAAVGLSQL